MACMLQGCIILVHCLDTFLPPGPAVVPCLLELLLRAPTYCSWIRRLTSGPWAIVMGQLVQLSDLSVLTGEAKTKMPAL
jgi:hypothetical protein